MLGKKASIKSESPVIALKELQSSLHEIGEAVQTSTRLFTDMATMEEIGQQKTTSEKLGVSEWRSYLNPTENLRT